MTKQVNSIEDFAEGLCSVDALPKAIYKGTNCGAWIKWDGKSVKVGSIVEGADVETRVHTLAFPTTDDAIWAALEEVEIEADDLWREWNDPDSEMWAL